MDAPHTFTKPALLFYRKMSDSTENDLVKSLGLVIRSKVVLEIEPNIQASGSSRMLILRAGGVKHLGYDGGFGCQERRSGRRGSRASRDGRWERSWSVLAAEGEVDKNFVPARKFHRHNWLLTVMRRRTIFL